MKVLNNFFSGILAGLAISLGGTVFLACDNKVVGAIFFSVGLFLVLTRGMALYTGKISYLFDNDLSYAAMLPVMWLGNLAGSMISGYAIRLTRIVAICQKAETMCIAKLADGPISIFVLSVFCNIMVYFAVEGYKNNKHEFGKYFGIVFCIALFIICGFEHCVANMFYFSVANMWSMHTVVWLLIMTLGNSVGGIVVHNLTKLATPKK